MGLVELAALLFLKDHNSLGVKSPLNSGIVISGFGNEELLPGSLEYSVRGIANDRLCYDALDETFIDNTHEAAILPFAQSDIVGTLMEGIDPTLRHAIANDVSKVLLDLPAVILDRIVGLHPSAKRDLKAQLRTIAKAKIDRYTTRLRQHSQDHYISPVLEVVTMLPKDELAAMAETLVNVTKFKRRVSMGPETVGGPVDVAVISRGDGFVWIKRKHYFPSELNPGFMSGYLLK